MFKATTAKVMRQTWGSKDNLGWDNAQLRPGTHLPSRCNEKRRETKEKKEKKTRARTGHPAVLDMTYHDCVCLNLFAITQFNSQPKSKRNKVFIMKSLAALFLLLPGYTVTTEMIISVPSVQSWQKKHVTVCFNW